MQKARPDLLDRSPRVLQIAPDTGLEAQFRAMKGINYLSGDLQEPEAMVKLDLTRLDLPDQTFDLVICLHVLAHISNDRQAMREILRILRPGGTALIMTPMSQDATTYEDPCLITSEQRDKAYGEWDFVRLYGQDFSARLSEAGFTIEIVQPASEFSAGEMNKIGVWNDKIFVCQRPAE